ncbi:MAG: GyrI-like domain-containing protein [Candidatus Bipolaricaulis sp.]|nr:GyrI-like domain-containing protein [Candidatus Bipolaricaulis sp.]
MALKEVRIVDLPPMRVASSLGFGKQPEDQAWKQMQAFAAFAGIRLGEKGGQTYGFNNPDPTPGSENYGYEIWLPVGPDIEAAPPIQIKQVPGGKYAVTHFTGLSNIGRVWKDLVAWFEDSPYVTPPHWSRCLEALQNPLETNPEKYVFDLYLPIAE